MPPNALRATSWSWSQRRAVPDSWSVFQDGTLPQIRAECARISVAAPTAGGADGAACDRARLCPHEFSGGTVKVYISLAELIADIDLFWRRSPRRPTSCVSCVSRSGIILMASSPPDNVEQARHEPAPYTGGRSGSRMRFTSARRRERLGAKTRRRRTLSDCRVAFGGRSLPATFSVAEIGRRAQNGAAPPRPRHAHCPKPNREDGEVQPATARGEDRNADCAWLPGARCAVAHDRPAAGRREMDVFQVSLNLRRAADPPDSFSDADGRERATEVPPRELACVGLAFARAWRAAPAIGSPCAGAVQPKADHAR